MYIPRHLEEKIVQFAQYFKVVLILGARQVGKSTILQHVLPNLNHVVFDPVNDQFAAKSDPDLFLHNFRSPIILDEIQYVPELLSAIKRFVDRSEKKGQYFLTGSHNLMMLKTVAESMAGRVGIIELSPLSLYELSHKTKTTNWLERYLQNPIEFGADFQYTALPYTKTLYETIWYGGMPGVLDFPVPMVGDYLRSYLQTYLERDVRLVENIEDLTVFSRFLGILSALTAEEINYSHLGREIGLSPSTVLRWLSIMQTCYQWHEILPYNGNTIKRLSKRRKGYFFDTGIACYLQHIFSVESLATHPNLGSIFETWVVNQIKVLAGNLPFPIQLYHWRTNGGAEVDLLLEHNNIFYPIEIKCKTNLNKYDAKGIMAFIKSYPHLNIATGLIIYAGDMLYKINDNVIAIPWNIS